jgi:hypothetical protein
MFVSIRTYLNEIAFQDGEKFLYTMSKNGNKIYIILEKDRQTNGFIFLDRLNECCWDVPSVAALKGYGWKMHEAAMDFVYPDWIVPYRDKQIKKPLYNTYSKFIGKEGIETSKIEVGDPLYVEVSSENDVWFNRKYRLTQRNGMVFTKEPRGAARQRGFRLFDNIYNVEDPNIVK